MALPPPHALFPSAWLHLTAGTSTFDPTGNGKVSFQEFSDWWLKEENAPARRKNKLQRRKIHNAELSHQLSRQGSSTAGGSGAAHGDKEGDMPATAWQWDEETPAAETWITQPVYSVFLGFLGLMKVRTQSVVACDF